MKSCLLSKSCTFVWIGRHCLLLDFHGWSIAIVVEGVYLEEIVTGEGPFPP